MLLCTGIHDPYYFCYAQGLSKGLAVALQCYRHHLFVATFACTCFEIGQHAQSRHGDTERLEIMRPVLQIENEYGFCWRAPDRKYLQFLTDKLRLYLGEDVIIYSTDPPAVIERGTLPGKDVFSYVFQPVI